MKSCIQYTKESVKEMKEDMLSWKNRLLKVKTRDEFTVDCIKKKKEYLFAIQFTGEDENIAKIERFAKPVFKRFKIDKHKDRFYLIVETIKSNYPGYITYPSYRLSIDDWIIFEAIDKQMELRVIYDKVFKEVFEAVL
jgi:hypothetical protein